MNGDSLNARTHPSGQSDGDMLSMVNIGKRSDIVFNVNSAENSRIQVVKPRAMPLPAQDMVSNRPLIHLFQVPLLSLLSAG
jgi:hypothetical protein